MRFNIEFEGQSLGKPGTASVAKERAQRVRGKSGYLHTGHCVIDTQKEREISDRITTKVTFTDMTDAEIDASFAKAAAAGDEEPEIGDIEKVDASAAQMSDDDYEAFMKVSDLENRLASTKSNILKLKKGYLKKK